nr:MAG TPA: hypothetical protein [Caudoviricetes sp.]
MRIVELGRGRRSGRERDLAHIGDIGKDSADRILHRQGDRLAVGNRRAGAETDKVDAVHAVGARVAADELVHDETVGLRTGVVAQTGSDGLLVGQAVAGEVNAAGRGLPNAVLHTVGEEVVRDVVMADLVEARRHNIRTGLLRIAVDGEVRAHDLRLEERRNAELQSAGVLHEVLHTVAVAADCREAGDNAGGGHGIRRAAVLLDRRLVRAGARQNVGNRAVGTAERSHRIVDGQIGARRGNNGAGLHNAVGGKVAADGDRHVVERAVRRLRRNSKAGSVGDAHDEHVAGAALHVAAIHAAVQAEIGDVLGKANEVVGSGVKELRIHNALGEHIVGLKRVVHNRKSLLCSVSKKPFSSRVEIVDGLHGARQTDLSGVFPRWEGIALGKGHEAGHGSRGIDLISKRSVNGILRFLKVSDRPAPHRGRVGVRVDRHGIDERVKVQHKIAFLLRGGVLQRGNELRVIILIRYLIAVLCRNNAPHLVHLRHAEAKLALDENRVKHAVPRLKLDGQHRFPGPSVGKRLEPQRFYKHRHSQIEEIPGYVLLLRGFIQFVQARAPRKPRQLRWQGALHQLKGDPRIMVQGIIAHRQRPELQPRIFHRSILSYGFRVFIFDAHKNSFASSITLSFGERRVFVRSVPVHILVELVTEIGAFIVHLGHAAHEQRPNAAYVDSLRRLHNGLKHRVGAGVSRRSEIRFLRVVGHDGVYNRLSVHRAVPVPYRRDLSQRNAKDGLRVVLRLARKILRKHAVAALFIRRIGRKLRVEQYRAYLLSRGKRLGERSFAVPVEQLLQPSPRVAVIAWRRVTGALHVHEVPRQKVWQRFRSRHGV